MRGTLLLLMIACAHWEKTSESLEGVYTARVITGAVTTNSDTVTTINRKIVIPRRNKPAITIDETSKTEAKEVKQQAPTVSEKRDEEKKKKEGEQETKPPSLFSIGWKVAAIVAAIGYLIYRFYLKPKWSNHG